MENNEKAPLPAQGNWEEELYDLAAINYNLYLGGTVERADTGQDWTFDDARWEIRDFIRTLLSLTAKSEYERGEKAGYIKGTDCEKWIHEQSANEARSSTLARVREMMPMKRGDFHDEGYSVGYDAALSDLLALIEKLEKHD